MDKRAFILSAFPFFKTPFFAALSNIEKAFDKASVERADLKASIAVFVFVLVDLLNPAFFSSDRSFFIADLVIGMAPFYHELHLAQVKLMN